MSQRKNAGPAWAGAGWVVGAALAWGCSSAPGTGGGFGLDGGTTDATGNPAVDSGGQVGNSDGSGTSEDGSGMTAPPMTCDASLQLPTDAGHIDACTVCLKANCMSALTMCSQDCVCVAGLECLVANDTNATLCPEAMSALGAGDPGLTAVFGCLPNKCDGMCHGLDGG
jgi:hypothetical protein